LAWWWLVVSVHLQLPGARVLDLKGWGRRADPKTTVRLEFADIGTFTAYRPSLLGEQSLLDIGIEQLAVQTRTEQLTTGGGYFGGGSGVLGAATGIIGARAMNRLSTRWHEYTLLGVFAFHENGSGQDALFGFENITESDLRDQLAESIPAWADTYTEMKLAELNADPVRDQDLTHAHAQVDGMRQRGMLTDDQALTLRAGISQPFIDTLHHRLATSPPSSRETREIIDQIDRMVHDDQITVQQAQLIRVELTRRIPPDDTTRQAQADALTRLRQTGAITEDEYQTERLRLLQPS
jgi:hypothetical protein